MKKLFLLLSSLFTLQAFAQQPGFKRWYRQPSGKTWTAALAGVCQWVEGEGRIYDQ